MYLNWLPTSENWNSELQSTRSLAPAEAFPRLIGLANYSLDFVETTKIDRVTAQFEGSGKAYLTRTSPLKLAILGSSTLSHLKAGIRVGALRRGFHVEIFEGAYGMYHQLLVDRSSELYAFQPDVVFLALDAHHVTAGGEGSVEQTLERIRACWELAREQLGASVIQQTILPLFRPLLGNSEHQYKSSPHSIIHTINTRLREEAENANVHLMALDTLSQVDGINDWYEPALWHRAKQEVHPRVSPLYGDHVARIVATIRGLSYKCLVLDLDNTLWGGVIGDDGLMGICLGQGDALGEAFVSFQRYLKAMANRGVILAVCSKNDVDKAKAAFQQHPEMVLREPDIACFVANWQDKAANIRSIAETLNIGLDSLVFVDDNPFERNLVRKELPMLAVPELPDDPALFEETLAAAGYFEALSLTSEDLNRARLYTENATRIQVQRSCTDMASYLKSLEMKLIWSSFDPISLPRVVQLINKSNQFNLTTRRYTHDEVLSLMSDSAVVTLQLRQTDVYGDNGIIGIIIGRQFDRETLEVDTWLMSCRVLGRQVEEASLNLLVDLARERGAKRLMGFYFPTAKNGMVQNHYERLGFTRQSLTGEANASWMLPVDDYEPKQTFADLVKADLNSKGDERDERTNICSAY